MQKKRKSKHAQVTIFIIIAIVLVIGIALYFLIRQSIFGVGVSSDVQPIYSFVEGCITQTGNKVIKSIGERGGEYFVDPLNLRLYYFDGKTYIPTKEQIAQEISNGISVELPFCTNEFTNFLDYQVTEGEIKTTTEILDDKVILNVNYPLTLTKGDKTTQIEKFKSIEIPIRLGVIYNAANEITQDQLQNEKYLIDGKTKEVYCLTCLSGIANKNEVYINPINYDEQTILFIISDEKSKINDKPFVFMFANKYQIE